MDKWGNHSIEITRNLVPINKGTNMPMNQSNILLNEETTTRTPFNQLFF
ncbi:hypothetical protein J8J04_00560 ['Fragaria x ananassa' phyllody phytoplasma]|uniref:Uncharacterized protein n=1 Tax='Fragaria x ananassa' phyllody phytoplasma TaxID=2358428 RepID=A0ABS5K2U7_9MOLU|nr:hypothetical protein ['Fragaria x ananassa' phyllody phytoplasma]MBS2126212.1 hypothetical protein ['Fragaria x ananassa' phyllody phytoplasma]